VDKIVKVNELPTPVVNSSSVEQQHSVTPSVAPVPKQTTATSTSQPSVTATADENKAKKAE
jgi:hypothetical protein